MSRQKSSETRDFQKIPDSKTRAQTLACIQAVREGSQESFSSLLEQYRPLLERAVARFASRQVAELNREDLWQEATLVFYHSILTYDTEQSEVEFGLYAKICINNGLVSRLRSLTVRDELPLSESLEHPASDPTERILEEEGLEQLDGLIRTHLSEYEYRVWRLYVSGKRASDIGALIGRDEKSVANAIYRIRKKLRAALS